MEYVEVARAESERGEVVLLERRDADADADADADDAAAVALALRVNGVFVMDTRETRTERAMASVALGQVDHPRRVLVGGLGLGFTMHEVLADQRVERLVVVEVEAALVTWMGNGTVPHGPSYLDDTRLTVTTGDIRASMAQTPPATYDLILLDVDNGPGFLVYQANAAIYQRKFLAQALASLRTGGALAIWSAAESPDLRREMKGVFGNVVPIAYDVRLQGRHEQYWLYMSRNGS